MSGTSDELILKAAKRWTRDVQDTRYKGLVANTRLNAFAEVAADILGIAMTPFEFEQALKHALSEYPMPNVATNARAQAELKRSDWAILFLTAVYARLS